MKLLNILKETVDEKASFTNKYDDEMKGGQKKLPDQLQQAILKKKGLKKEAVTSPKVQDAFDKITDALSKISKRLSDDESYELHEKLKGWFNKLHEDKRMCEYCDGTGYIKESINEGEDHEVSMAQSSLKTIISSASQLMDKIGQEEKDIPGWIQDHITNAENYINQANKGYHEL